MTNPRRNSFSIQAGVSSFAMAIHARFEQLLDLHFRDRFDHEHSLNLGMTTTNSRNKMAYALAGRRSAPSRAMANVSVFLCPSDLFKCDGLYWSLQGSTCADIFDKSSLARQVHNPAVDANLHIIGNCLAVTAFCVVIANGQRRSNSRP